MITTSTMAKVNLLFKKSAIYVGSGAEVNNVILFKEKMEGLKIKLIEQFEKSRGLKEWIASNLEQI